MNLWTDGSNTAEQSLCFQGIMWEKDILLQIPEYSKAVPINHLLLVGGKKFFTSFMTHVVRRQCGSSPAIRSIRSEEPSLSAARTPRGSSAGAVLNSRNWGWWQKCASREGPALSYKSSAFGRDGISSISFVRDPPSTAPKQGARSQLCCPESKGLQTCTCNPCLNVASP